MSFLFALALPRYLRLFEGETPLAGYSEVVSCSRRWTYRNAYGLQVVSTRFEDLWLTLLALRTLVLELLLESRAWTSCSLEDCLRAGSFCFPEDLERARPYYPLNISLMASWTMRKAASMSVSTKTNNTSLRKCLTLVGISRTLRTTRS